MSHTAAAQPHTDRPIHRRPVRPSRAEAVECARATPMPERAFTPRCHGHGHGINPTPDETERTTPMTITLYEKKNLDGDSLLITRDYRDLADTTLGKNPSSLVMTEEDDAVLLF